ncbi:MAG: 4-hydroxy-tetrahydrodipicolinate synthase [Bdellovibrionaceae bacterium]|nr:4-hydroxy-tetrahydrodipicolinate synthase [Pseudobdellovibrionaceae bacterium]|tara:strand:- start:76700 stop:77572 length:873 start_codon:yes stop_codon:yes gene_type:complete
MSFTPRGVYTALVTPFKDGSIDFKSYERLLKHQLDNGVQGFVVNGTTAESPALKVEEVRTLFEKTKSFVSGQVPLILGTGSNATFKAIHSTKLAKEWGADAALVVCPYYNKPTQAGMKAHFLAIADSVDIPLVLYNVPGRTIVSLNPQTTVELSAHPNIISIKEASGDMDYLNHLEGRLPEEFALLSGDDGTYYEFLNKGGHGVISVMSHLIPQKVVEWTKSQSPEGAKDFESYKDLIAGLFIEPNPTPTKWALKEMGIIESAECRLPLLGLSDDGQAQLRPLLEKAGLI